MQRVIDLCNNFLPNLELLVCSTNAEKLQNVFGLRKRIISSLSFHGALRGFKNYRTIWVHHLEGNQKVSSTGLKNELERSFILNYSLQSVATIKHNIKVVWGELESAKYDRRSLYKGLKYAEPTKGDSDLRKWARPLRLSIQLAELSVNPSLTEVACAVVKKGLKPTLKRKYADCYNCVESFFQESTYWF